ncbi:MAG: HD domain-containing protein [Lachnospiraceae bacterium]|nr:HD domain-containing protein [Lachnospiraceae bacterium]
MAGKRMLTSRLTADMITQDDVYTAEEQLLIPEGTVLTDAIIASIKERSIFAVRIQVKEDGKTPVLASERSKEPETAAEEPAGPAGASETKEFPKEDSGLFTEGTKEEASFVNPVPDIPEQEGTKEYYEKVRETKEFKEFQTAFTETVDSLKNTLEQVVRGEEIRSEEILKETENVVSKSRNSLHILDMLQCMKGYDDMTYMHCLNVAILSNLIGKVSGTGMSDEELELLTLSGLLHDIGKIMIPDDVLQKPDHLTIPEYNLVKTHVLQGHNILKDRNLDERVIDAVMRHHERMDGSGYPGGYVGEKIGKFPRILAIADTFDAMTSKRPYRDAICPFKVIEMFEREGITKYDVEYLLPFLNTVVQAYINTEVELSNGETGKVVLINREALSRPVVKVGAFYCDLLREPGVTIERILGI